MKRIRFEPHEPAEIRASEQQNALQILAALHHYAETGVGSVKALSGLLSNAELEYKIGFVETSLAAGTKIVGLAIADPRYLRGFYGAELERGRR